MFTLLFGVVHMLAYDCMSALIPYDYFNLIDGYRTARVRASLKKIQLIRRNLRNKENFYASKIQIRWKEAISNPSFGLCKSRLLMEFEQIDI